MPQINQHILHRLASIHIQDTDIKIQRNTKLVLRHILSQCLRARPNIRASSDFRSQDRSIVLENLVIRSLCGDDNSGVGTSCERAALVVLDPAFLVHGCGCGFASLGKPGATGDLVVV